ncbi:hypothetical protein [Streptomyces zagrosensis]|uniref:Uncharacterized protein n=1 Tax=Streptomyces zagrosensis TaxID=1042984 RepID=A0A7W9QDE2_9ACTN|nr:hypothetical protein [Streptomyces zagrosensis]MBB5938061.1 hypothetical protein [Streptomyces zagrosensis]
MLFPGVRVVTVMLFVGGMVGAVVALYWRLRQRGKRRTEAAEGLLIEQERLRQLHGVRTSYNSISMHNMHGLTSEDLYKYHR